MANAIRCISLGISFCIWRYFYEFFKKRYPSKTPEYWSRCITLWHGVIVTSLALCIELLKNVHIGILGDSNIVPLVLLVISWGYFAVDTLWCFFYKDKVLIRLHHFVSLIGLTIYIFRDKNREIVATALGYLEVTNPCLQMRWFLREAGHEDTFLYMIVEGLFLASFTIIRLIIGSYYLMIFLSPASTFEIIDKILAAAVYTLGLFLLREIIIFVRHKISHRMQFESAA